MDNRIEDRFQWADVVLKQAGFQEWGRSDEHGLSVYYIPSGAAATDEEHVRIRVSDHYAHPAPLRRRWGRGR